MNWDERAKQNAIWCGYNSLALGVAEAKGIQTVYTHAAQWQRDQLKSKEAIERAAKTIHETTQFPGPQPSWEEMKKTNPDYCTYRRDLVEETINALLGED